MFCLLLSMLLPVCLRLCVRNIFGIYPWIFVKLFSLMHLGTKMNWLEFVIEGSRPSRVNVTLSRQRHQALDPAIK